MEGMREYILSVVTAALICSILMSIISKGAAKEWIRLLCGLFLTITVLRPMGQLDLNMLTEYPFEDSLEAKEVAAVGERMAEDAMAQIIKEEAEAYILDKAAAMNTELTVDIAIGDGMLPASAILCGEVSPHVRRQIETILETDLGITKENQVWTG